MHRLIATRVNDDGQSGEFMRVNPFKTIFTIAITSHYSRFRSGAERSGEVPRDGEVGRCERLLSSGESLDHECAS